MLFRKEDWHVLDYYTLLVYTGVFDNNIFLLLGLTSYSLYYYYWILAYDFFLIVKCWYTLFDTLLHLLIVIHLFWKWKQIAVFNLSDFQDDYFHYGFRFLRC